MAAGKPQIRVDRYLAFFDKNSDKLLHVFYLPSTFRTKYIRDVLKAQYTHDPEYYDCYPLSSEMAEHVRDLAGISFGELDAEKFEVFLECNGCGLETH